MGLQNIGFTSNSSLKQINSSYSQAYNIVSNINGMNGYSANIASSSINAFPYGFASLAPDNTYAIAVNPGDGIMNATVIGHIVPFTTDHIVTKSIQSNRIIKGDGGFLYSQSYAVAAKLDSIAYLLKDFKKTALSGEDTSALLYNILSTITEILTAGKDALNTHTHIVTGVVSGSDTVTSNPTTTQWTSDVSFNSQKQYIGNGTANNSKALINDNFEEFSG